MTIPDLRPAFPFATPITNYRNSPGHTQLCDREFFDSCGYATDDEAAILYRMAKTYGGDWLEIGSHTGWTAAHIIAGGANQYTGLDPEYGHPQYNKTMEPFRFLKRAAENIKRANPGRLEGLETMLSSPCRAFYLDRISLMGEKSWDILPEMAMNWQNDSQADRPEVTFDFVFIDGEHEPPVPAVDAMLVHPMLKPDCAVFFHDAIGGPVRAGVEWLRRQGFNVHYYKTAQIVGVAWRGNITPPPFEPQPVPGFSWDTHMNHLNNCPQAQIDAWIVKAEEFLKAR
jgi:hypothetical protein